MYMCTCAIFHFRKCVGFANEMEEWEFVLIVAH